MFYFILDRSKKAGFRVILNLVVRLFFNLINAKSVFYTAPSVGESLNKSKCVSPIYKLLISNPRDA